MFLKNWDMIKNCEITLKAVTNTYKENEEIYCRNYAGNYAMPSLSDSRSYGGTSIYSWYNGTYLDNPYSEYYTMLWPGGDIDGVPARIQPIINRDKVRYEDWNLYSPFRGGNTPGSGQIYGQPHTVTNATYNSELDQWEKTVTREFKNESGYTITIREIGVFHDETCLLIAREILDTPIEVANDSYFKISWTYKVEHPFEHQKEKRIRQYTDYFANYYNATAISDKKYIISPQKRSKALVIRKHSIGAQSGFKAVEDYKEIFALGLKGWTLEKNITSFLLDDRETVADWGHNFFISIDILTPDLTEENSISMLASSSSHWSYNGFSNQFSILPLTSKIKDIELLDVSKKLEPLHLVTNEEEKNHLIWLGLSSPRLGEAAKSYQADLQFCDCAYRYNSYATTFFFDETQAKNHSFYVYNNAGYPATIVVKLQATTENDTPLYEDIPVQR
jgi:hypothetical protein